jgi:hypothetical protein
MMKNERPIARSSDVVVQPLNDEVLIYDVLTNKAFSLNETSARVWNSCDGNNTVDDIIKEIGYENVVRLALADLEENSLLDATTSDLGLLSRTSRRELMISIAKGSLAALPVILAVTAPTAAQTASCLPIGALCGSSSQCCINNSGVRCCKAGACAQGSGGCAP